MATTPFEQKFGILASSALNNKMPGLSDDSLGFQVVQVEDDESRGFGVQVYDIGKHLVLVPMFFLKGKIKGGEVMYVKDVDRFLPLTEMEINNLKSGKTFSMGEPVEDKDKNKGTAYRVSTMELNWLNSKRAGEVMLFDAEDIQKMLEHGQGTGYPISLKDIRMFGPKAASDLVRNLHSSPALANALLSVHTKQEISDALMPLLEAEEKVNKIASMRPAEKLTFIDDPFSKEAAELPDEQKKLLMKYGIVAIDNRKEAAVALREKKTPTRWSTPTTNGTYDIVLKDGSTIKGTVICTSVNADSCVPCECCSSDDPVYSPTKSDSKLGSSKVTVFSDGKAWNCKRTEVCVDVNTMEDANIGDEVTAANLRERLLKKGEYGWENHASFPKNEIVIYDPKHDIAYDGKVTQAEREIIFRPNNGKGLRIVLTGKGGAMFIKGGILYVPSTAKLIAMNKYDSPSSWEGLSSSVLADALVDGGFTTVKVSSDGRRWRIDDKNGGTELSDYNTNFRYLVKNVGLRAKEASQLLEDVSKTDRNGQLGEPLSFWCKSAAMDPLDPTDDPWFGTGDDHFITREAGKLGGPLDTEAIERIRKASNTGVKEVVDTQVMSELARCAYSVDKTQDYLSVFAKALDRLCRSLILFYWHNEEFEERYGKQNLPQLEDALKDNIRSLGDLMGYIKDKNVQNDTEIEDDDDLSEEMA